MDLTVNWLCRHKIKGSYRLVRWLARSRPDYCIHARTIDRLVLRTNPSSHLGRLVVSDGDYERQLRQLLLQRLDHDAVFWDIGANIGVHTVAIQHARPEVSVFSFEPNPLTFGILYNNCKINSVKPNLRCLALADEQGYQALRLCHEQVSGLTSFLPSRASKYEHEHTCWCDTGDHIVDHKVADAPNVVKIDVEGYEKHVLEGMTNLLQRRELHTVVFESNQGPLTDQSPVHQLLRSYGFTVEPIEEQAHGNFLASR